MRAVSRSVDRSTPQTIEDACAYAWAQFLEHQPDRALNWQGWMFRTAQRQAWLLERHARDTLPIWEDRHNSQRRAPDTLAIRRDVQDALWIVGRLPPRLQRIAVLRAFGMRHSDIGEITGDSPTRVSQLITRANDEIHDILAERHHATKPSSPRAERLWELESDPPEWLTRHIGRVPRHSRRQSGQTLQRRAWRRAAIALDDYRGAAGPERFDEQFDAPIRDAELGRLRQTALRAVENLEHTRDRDHRRGLDD
jgi:hypothetical protein